MIAYNKHQLLDLLREEFGFDNADFQATLTDSEREDEQEEFDGTLVKINVWLARGDGVAVYENHDLGHELLGHKKFVSYGSTEAQLEVSTPPQTLPDIGPVINWRYQLIGTYREKK